MRVRTRLGTLLSLLLALTGTITLVSPAAAAEACSHPYFPVREGATWRYRAGMPALPILMGEDTVSLTAVTDTGFLETRVVGGNAGTIARRWVCAADGLGYARSGGTLQATDLPTIIGTVQLDAENVVLPAPDRWQPGYSWTQRLGGTFSGLDVVPGTTPTAQGAMETVNVIVGQEMVTVPAGTFAAWRIERRSTGQVTTTIGGREETMDVTNSQTAWYVERVGLVKAINTLDDMVIDQMELLAVPG
jgi:hypothetical protein